MNRKITSRILWLLVLLGSVQLTMAHRGTDLRRPISASQPAWIIHIDVWNTADPQKIIDMVPADVRPYVIFNISTSSNDNLSPSGPAIYDSWMKVCAQNRVWTMIQCASGAYNRMPDDGSTTAYEYYFKVYPNFLGFNFAEQFWGYGENGNATFVERLQLFADLLPVCHQYGGYLAVSFCDSYYNASKMPIAYMKRNAQLRNFLTNDPHHFLCFEKYTLKKNFLDIESNCLGAWLGGYAGQYGIRFDNCGWLSDTDVTDKTKGGSAFVTAAGALPIVEHVMLTGETMIDGPELIRTQCSEEKSTTTTDDGYIRRNWGWFPQFQNISLDLFRKILDGTLRIPSRQEVIERTKICVVNDINTNLSSDTEYNSYVTPETLFDGLYRSSADKGGLNGKNNWLDNRWWTKSTGRYPTIPQVYALIDNDAKQLTAIKKSQYLSRWSSVDAKVAELNELFPVEYTGDIFAGRMENAWVTYNPYQYDESVRDGYRVCSASTKRAQGNIPFQYNTCDHVTLDYAPYSLGVMKEYAGKLTFYLNNYQTDGRMVEDVITIYGAKQRPTCDVVERGSHQASTVTKQWDNSSKTYTIAVRHDGPLDMTVTCSGNATGRKRAFLTADIYEPDEAPAYNGLLQYEAEFADYQELKCRKNGYGLGHDGYYGQGYAEMTSINSKLRNYVTVPANGSYKLNVIYQAATAGSICVEAGGTTYELHLPATTSWATATVVIELQQDSQPLIISNNGPNTVLLDCIQLQSTMPTALLQRQDVGIRSSSTPVDYYNLQGQSAGSPRKGVYIVRMSDGTIKKIAY